MPPRPSILKQGTQIGPWQLSRFLGSGGQGEVWSVRNKKEEHSPPRALKACFATEEKGQSRFLREVKLLDECRHHHILTMVAQEPGWNPWVKDVPPFAFFVAELCDGSLEQQQGLLGNLLTRLDLFKQACAAVSFLHSRPEPVIHRDIKPGNFLMANEPKRLVLADFGIARPLQSDQQLTGTQEVVGTPHFRAPEILAGNEGSARSDIYCLGRLLEWLLTEGVSKELSAVRTVPRTPDVSEEVCALLDGVIKKATAMAPAERFSSVADLLRALPDLQVSIRPTTVPAHPDQTPLVPAAIRTRVIEIARSKDRVGWRELEGQVRREYPRRATEWFLGFDNYDIRQKDGRFAAADGLFEAALPRIILALSAVEMEEPNWLTDQRHVLEDLLDVPGWPRSGLTMLVEARCFPVYVFHYLHGALCCLLKRIDWALDMVETEVATPNERGPMRVIGGLVGYPKLLNDDPVQGWEYLRRASDQFPVATSFFSLKKDYEIALTSYSMLLALLELAYDSPKFADRSPADLQLNFEIPPMFITMGSDVISSAARRIFGDRRVVAQVAERAKANVDIMKKLWPAWVASFQRIDLAVRRSLFSRDLPLGTLA